MSTHKEIEILLSLPRVEKYKKINDDWFIGYNKDIETSKNFYKKLHFLEIFLRNRIDVEISKIFSENWILPNENFPLSNKSAIRLKNIKFSTKNDIVSNASFGFWTGIFHSSEHDLLWIPNHTLLKSIFPYLKKHQRKVKQIELELDKIRRLRNRVFHFEPLFEMNLEELDTLICKYIKGMCGSEVFEMIFK